MPLAKHNTRNGVAHGVRRKPLFCRKKFCVAFVNPGLLYTRLPAIPAFAELAFQCFAATRAAPLLMRMFGGGFTFEKGAQQAVGFAELVVVGQPNLAYVGGQIADAAGQKLAAHERVDALGFEVAAYQMRFGGVLCGIEGFHTHIRREESMIRRLGGARKRC